MRVLGAVLEVFETGQAAELESEAATYALLFAVKHALLLPTAARPGERSEAELLELFAAQPGLLARLELSGPAEAADWLCQELIDSDLAAADRIAAAGLEHCEGSPTEAWLHLDRAEIDYLRWRLDGALEHVERAYRPPLEADLEYRLLYLEGRIRLRAGRTEQAGACLDELEALSRRHPQDRELAAYTAHLRSGYLMSAELFEDLLAECSTDTPEGKLSAAIAHGELARLGRRSFEPAIRLYREVIEASGELGDERLLQQARLRLGEVHLHRGELDEARAKLSAWASAPAPTNLDEHLRGEAARARLELLADADPGVLAERRAGLSDPFERALAARRNLALQQGGVGLLHFLDMRRAASELIELTRRLAGAEAAFEELLRIRDLGTLSRTLRGDRADRTRLADVQALLPSGAGALCYLPAPERTHLFLVDAAGVRCELLDPLSAWNDDRDAAHRHLSNPPAGAGARAELDGALARLAAQLLPPDRVEPAVLSWDQVFVEGLDLAGYLPLEPLPLSSGAPLGQVLPVSYLPSLAVGVELAARRDTYVARCDLTLLAAPSDVDPPAIDWRRRHQAPLESGSRRGRFVAFVGEDADRAGLRRAFESAPSWMLLVLHGTYDPRRERPAGFLLGVEPPAAPGAGSMRAAEPVPVRVFADDLDRFEAPPLVFLGICGAARAQVRTGDDGVNELAGALLRAGAHTVVVSPIDLDFAATAQLAATFARGLAAGAAPAEALRTARVELAATEGYGHPYYHSTLHVVGLGHRPVFAEPLELGPSPLVKASAAALLALWIWLHRRLGAGSPRRATRT